MESIVIKGAQLLLSLSILVVLHEFGHFLPARIFKVRVEKFYLFFDAWFSLFKKKIGQTVYGIGWIPLGGYVKLSGMIDESMDRDQMKAPPEPHEFRAKPAWQRLIIMLGGVTVNLILGFLIYIMILFTWGREYLPIENLPYGVHADSVMIENGFQDGDKILSVAGQKPKTLGDVSQMILIDGQREVTVERDGSQKQITLPEDITETLLDKGVQQLFAPRVPFYVDSILPGTPAMKSSLKKGDRIVAVNGQETPYFLDFVKSVENLSGDSITVGVQRDGQEVTVPLFVNQEGKIGVANRNPTEYIETKKISYSFGEAVPAGISFGYKTLANYVESLKLLFSPSGVKQLGGFGTIGSLFSPTWNWQSFWQMTALLSIILAFMNILPIPALDGGHVMFLLYEMIAGRAPSQKFLEYAQIVGMILLLLLLIIANGNDVIRALS